MIYLTILNQMKTKTKRNTIQWILILLLVFPLGIKGQPSGKYEGEINVLGRQIGIEFKLNSDNNEMLQGTISIPSQGAYNLALKSVDYSDGEISMRVDTGRTGFRFQGQYYKAEDSLAGTFYQAGYEGTFQARAKVREKTSWIDREVTFRNDSIQLAGVVSLPDTGKVYPAVIFISGSGTQDRDENVMGFKVFKQLSKYFIESGYAVFRYDDRGAGESDYGNVEEATTADLTEDALSAYQFLKTHKCIDPGKIGFLGHSEGSIIANRIAAKRNDIAFTIMMGGPVLKGYNLMLEQTRAITTSQGMSKKEINKTVSINKTIYKEVMKEDPDWEKIETTLKRSLQDEGESTSESILKQKLKQQLKKLKFPWFQYFLSYNPGKDLRQLNCPVLALFGEKDTQVPPAPNIQKLKKIKRANSKAAITIKTIPEANHLFQKAKTGSPSEYSKAPKSFVSGFPETIIQWTDKIIRD